MTVMLCSRMEIACLCPIVRWMYACMHLSTYLCLSPNPVRRLASLSPCPNSSRCIIQPCNSTASTPTLVACRKTIPSVHRTPSLRRYFLTQTAQQFPSFLHDARSSPLSLSSLLSSIPPLSSPTLLSSLPPFPSSSPMQRLTRSPSHQHALVTPSTDRPPS